jgi:hypothetical protein
VVPPENSAASQYTEAVPTAGGNQQADGGGKGGHRSPTKVLGERNAHRLDSHGKEGHEVAEVVVETAPTQAAASDQAPPPEAKPAHKGGGKKTGTSSQHPHRHHEAGNGGRAAPPPQPKPETTPADLPDGSSALGEVIGAATGSSSSGQLGALLPLAIAGGLIWSFLYFRRQRRQLG